MALYEPRMLPRTPPDPTICSECKKPLSKADQDGNDPPLCDPCLTFVCNSFKD